MQQKKKTIITIGAAVVLLGLILLVPQSRASLLDSFRNLLSGLVPEATSTPSTAPQTSLYQPTVNYENAVVSAVEKTTPAVVSIVITKDVPIVESCPYNPFGNLPPEFQQFFGSNDMQFYAPCPDSGKTQKQEVGGGSGFIVSPDGLIVTNKHVVLDPSADYTVFTEDGKKYDAKVVSRDPSQDVALIKITPPDGGLPTVTLGDSDTLKLGQTAIAIGNALGEFQNSVSVGVISGLSRNITAGGEGNFTENINDVIQTDAAINAGNSGGPLLNLRGEVVGMNTAMAQDAQSIGFAIPINVVKRDIQSVEKTGEIQAPYLGVRYLSIDADIAKAQNLPASYGALVRGNQDGPAVVPNSPAEQAGLQAEDIILKVDGKQVTIDTPLSELIGEHNVGDTVTLDVFRNGKEITLQATLEAMPKNL